MRDLNWSRIILGGLLAGVVINLGAWIADGILLRERYEAQLGKETPMTPLSYVAVLAAGFLLGIVAVWVYAAIRSQYKPGAGTAVVAAVMVWLASAVAPSLVSWGSGVFGPRLLAAATAAALVYLVLGTVLGAWIYRPAEEVGLEPGVSA